MFGTSGIRGIYGKFITEDLAERVASIFAEGKMTIGRDIRSSGPSLRNAVRSGVLAVGGEVIDLGIVPTPTAALSTKKYACNGIMLTASHNPPEYNGLKLIKDGKEIDKRLEKEITAEYNKSLKMRNKSKTSKELDNIYHDNQIIDDHKDLVKRIVDTKTIERKKPKIIVDCNGAASVITPQLLGEMGCRVLSVNASTECFNRPSEPREENLPYLPDLIRSSGSDFAIAHDGDGDRCVIFDELGQMLSFDVQLAMMIEHEMGTSSNRKIVSTVESSLTIRDVVEQNGGKIEITPVGSTWVGDEMERSEALFGGEPCGEYIYQEGVHVPDAILAAAKFAEIFSSKGRFSELKKKYRQNFMAREKFPANDKHAAMEWIKGNVTTKGRIRDDDGIRVDEEDGWFLVRASGTEPIIRLTMEYSTKEKMLERKKEITQLIINGISE